MSDAIDDSMTVTMDESGRLVLPKAIREEAGIAPGTPLRIRVRDGQIEIQPTYAKVRFVQRGALRVAELVEPAPPLDEETLRRLKREGRERRKKWY